MLPAAERAEAGQSVVGILGAIRGDPGRTGALGTAAATSVAAVVLIWPPRPADAAARRVA